MRLIRVGQVTINFDLVTGVRDLSVTDASGQVHPGPVRVEFGGGNSMDIRHGADELRSWLVANSLVLTQPTPP